jgi:hypothetical protein
MLCNYHFNEDENTIAIKNLIRINRDPIFNFRTGLLFFRLNRSMDVFYKAEKLRIRAIFPSRPVITALGENQRRSGE